MATKSRGAVGISQIAAADQSGRSGCGALMAGGPFTSPTSSQDSDGKTPLRGVGVVARQSGANDAPGFGYHEGGRGRNSGSNVT